ncbi:MAG: tetratricopeptide repeat protein [Spirochaetia bacterium]|nr:tetratricopeptide repeat protein [Spirochaetia bacterium]
MNIKNAILSVAFVFCLVFAAAASDPVTQAEELFAQKKYDSALKAAITVKQMYPKTEWYLQALELTARIYEKQKQYDKSVEAYKEIFTSYPGTERAEEAYFSIGRIRSSRGEAALAVKSYELYLKNYPHGEYRVMALFDAGGLNRELGRDGEALRNYGEILKYYPGDVWFYSWSAIYSGHIYMKRRDFDRAIENYQRVIKTDENMVLYTLSALNRAQAFMEKDDCTTARAIFNEILRTPGGYLQEEALYGLGKANYKLGEYDLAKEIYISLLQMFPDTVWRPNVEKGLKLMDKKIESPKNKKDRDL